MTPEQDWKALARAVRARRAELGRSQAQLKELGGPSRETVRAIEVGTRTSYYGTTFDQLDTALGWRSGIAERIVNGDAPENPRTWLREDVVAHDQLSAASLAGYSGMTGAVVDGKREPSAPPTAPVSLPEHDQLPDRAHDALLTAMTLDRQLRELARLPNIDRELLEAAYRISYRLTREMPVLNLAAYARDEELAEVLRRIEADEQAGDRAQSSTG